MGVGDAIDVSLVAVDRDGGDGLRDRRRLVGLDGEGLSIPERCDGDGAAREEVGGCWPV